MLKNLEQLKKEYVKIQKKYKLPSFDLLNREFEIERISDRETELLLREIRKTMTEKIIVFLRFLEMLLNPTNAPFFMFAIIKNLSSSEKKLVEKVYKELCDFEISAISLDIHYNEEKEAEFIKKITKKWQELKNDFMELGAAMEKAWHASSEKKEKGYFG